jgi:hypothetical protein
VLGGALEVLVCVWWLRGRAALRGLRCFGACVQGGGKEGSPASWAICIFVSLTLAATSRRHRSLSARCCRSIAASLASHSLACLFCFHEARQLDGARRHIPCKYTVFRPLTGVYTVPV